MAAMVAASLWGRTHIDPVTRIRARAGPTGIDWTMSKTTALVLSPVMGLIVLLGTLSMRDGDPASWLGLAVMIIFLFAHWSSVKRAAR